MNRFDLNVIWVDDEENNVSYLKRKNSESSYYLKVFKSGSYWKVSINSSYFISNFFPINLANTEKCDIFFHLFCKNMDSAKRDALKQFNYSLDLIKKSNFNLKRTRKQKIKDIFYNK